MLAGIVGLLLLAYRVSSFSEFERSSTYTLNANFDNIGGLKIRAPVTVSGVKIGQVTNIVLDPTTFKAKVTLIIDEQDNDLPTDTSASIYTQGLLGSNYISLSPGFSEQSLKNGDVIATTRSALILEDLIGQLMFKLTGSDSDEKTSENDSTATSAAPVTTETTVPNNSDNASSGSNTTTNTAPLSTQLGTAAT